MTLRTKAATHFLTCGPVLATSLPWLKVSIPSLPTLKYQASLSRSKGRESSRVQVRVRPPHELRQSKRQAGDGALREAVRPVLVGVDAQHEHAAKSSVSCAARVHLRSRVGSTARAGQRVMGSVLPSTRCTRRRYQPEIAHLERRESPFFEPRQELGNVAVCLAVEGMKRGVPDFLGLAESCVEVTKSDSRLSRQDSQTSA